MNIEIANRLVNLRKSNQLSQEALAQKLGISRQAVSKWERAEASPDTDNLILLARLYGVSLDELLKTDDEIPRPIEEYEDEEAEREPLGEGAFSEDEKPEYMHVGFSGVHVKDKNGEVHVGWDGIHVDDRKKGDNVHIDQKGIYVNGERYDKYDWISHHAHFPVVLLITLAYVIIGCAFGAWHPGWLLFLLIPIWNSLIEAIKKKNAHIFAYPVLAVLIFLCLGLFYFAWHPGWVIFLTIPLYYSLVSYCRSVKYGNKSGEENGGDDTPERVVDADEEQ